MKFSLGGILQAHPRRRRGWVGLCHAALTLLLAGPAWGEVTVGGSAGGFVPLAALDPTVVVGVEAGWSRGPLGIALALDAAQPAGDGRAGDARWTLRARELRIALLAVGRWPDRRPALRPFVAAGPALLLVETRETGELGGERFGAVVERAVAPGLVICAGVEAALGPGHLFGAAGLGLAAFDGELTGKASAAALDLRVGYRFRL